MKHPNNSTTPNNTELADPIPRTEMIILYGTPSGNQACIFNVSQMRIPANVLQNLVACICWSVLDTVMVTSSKNVPRQLVNAMWSFEADDMAKWCCGGIFTDTAHGTNDNHRFLKTLCCKDGNNETIIAAQGLLIDQKRQTFVTAHTVLIPYCVQTEVCYLFRLGRISDREIVNFIYSFIYLFLDVFY